MEARKVTDDVVWVGAIDWDRRVFDELMPLPEGTSYNSYLVRGSKQTALIDTVDPAQAEVLLSRIASAGVDRIDYIVAHHAEQDHSGSIPHVLAAFPAAKVVVTDKCKGMLRDLLDIDDNRVVVVKDGDSLDLGGLTLQFIHFPWVHWPETMLTWLPERRVLFPCDLFGSHLATGDLFASDEAAVLLGAKRYYAEIMMPFRAIIEKQLPKIAGHDIAYIAPSHGPIYKNPRLILDAYRDWVGSTPRNVAVVPYISMHDSTRRMVEHVVDGCTRRGVLTEQFNLGDADVGRLAMLLVDAATVVVGTPMVLSGAHPKAVYAAYLMNLIRPKLRHLSVIGSFGWGGKLVEQLVGMMPNIKAEVLSPVLCRGAPKASDFAALDALAAAIADRHAAL